MSDRDRAAADLSPVPSDPDTETTTEKAPRPEECCGACPEIVGGGYDCTCDDNPRCPNYQAEMSRWEVFQSLSGWWACPTNSLGVMDDKAKHFPTHAEALAYADRMARQRTVANGPYTRIKKEKK